MNLLESRNNDSAIEARFIEQTLRDQAAGILKDSRREMRGFSQSKWRDVKMSVNKNELVYEHLGVHRFIDMKTRSASNRNSHRKMRTGKVKKKNYPVHNKIIFSHKRFLIKQLSFGFTDEVKESFRRLIQDSEK